MCDGVYVVAMTTTTAGSDIAGITVRAIVIMVFNRRRPLSCKLTDGFKDTFYRVYFNNSVVGY